MPCPYPFRYISPMNEVRKLRERAGLTQDELATEAGTSQPTIAAYEAGRKSPNLTTLRRLADAVGFEMTVEYHPPLTREERRSLFLHRAIAEHLAEDPEPVLDQARKTLRRMREQSPTPIPLLREWEVLLDRPLEHLISLLTDPDPHARELRQVTPFAGILSAPERAEVYRVFSEEEKERS